jgi:putative redox protein
VLACRLMSEGDDLRANVSVDLEWEGELRFRGRSAGVELVLDSDGRAGPSPVQALVMALAGCMAIDVVHILRKGRLDVKGVGAALAAERAPADPRRLVRVRLHFRVTGDVHRDKVERAIALSRETYCSVWHSLRPDTDFVTSFEVAAAP